MYIRTKKEDVIMGKIVKEYLIITLGVLLVVFGTYFFKFPNNFSIGGVTGLAVLLTSLTGGAVSSSTIVTVLNIALLIIGFLILGKDFGAKTAYGSILLSAALAALERIYPMDQPFTSQPILELAYAVALPAVGSAILFNLDASTGGTDIVAMILKKFTNTNTGQALLYSDLLLTLAAFLVFDMATGLLSLLGLVLKSLVVDNVIESLNLCKYFTVICEDPHPICEYITKELNRSATVLDGKGAFTDKDKQVVLTVMNRYQAIQLRRFIRQTQPSAFILITNTSEIIGKGFRGGT